MAWRRPWVAIGGVVLVLAGAGYGAVRYLEAREAEAAAKARREREREELARAERKAELIARLRADSRGIIPPVLGGVALGMSFDEVRSRRTRMEAQPSEQSEGKAFHAETLENGAMIMYGFVEGDRLLVQLQIMSALPAVEAIGPHLQAMHDTYGAPTGVWDCPPAEGVAMRRFTWRKPTVGIADIFIIYEGRVSQTLYFAPNEIIGASLHRARCRPVAPEDVARFPQTTLPANAGAAP